MLPPVPRVGDAPNMRQRAFTLLVQVYDECRSAVEYVRRREGDAAVYTPSMFVKKRRRPTPVENEPPEVEDSESTTPAPTVPSTTVRPLVPSRLPITELEATG